MESRVVAVLLFFEGDTFVIIHLNLDIVYHRYCRHSTVVPCFFFSFSFLVRTYVLIVRFKRGRGSRLAAFQCYNTLGSKIW